MTETTVSIGDALAIKDAIESIEKDGPMKIASTTRIKLARLLTQLRSIAADFESTRVATVREIGGSDSEQLSGAKFIEFQDRMRAVLESTVTVRVGPIVLSELATDENQLPIGVISTLASVCV